MQDSTKIPVDSPSGDDATLASPGLGGEAAAQQLQQGKKADVSEEKAAPTKPSLPPLPATAKRIYPMTGIDNLALLMENDGYQTVCFSLYSFRTQLDYATVERFFRALAEAYPRYRYVVELDPALASRKAKAMEKGESLKVLSEKEEEEAKRGRRTRYTKSLKAGGPFRPARWRFDESFEVAQNIKQADLDGGDEKALDKLAGEFLGSHFDYRKPVWEAMIVNNINGKDGAKSALLIKIHHCFSDGQGMVMSYHTVLTSFATGQSVSSIQGKIDAASAGGSLAPTKRAGPTAAEQGAAVAQSKGHTKSASSGGVVEKEKRIGQRQTKPTIGASVRHAFHTVRGLYLSSRKTFVYEQKGAPRASGRLYTQSRGISMADIKLIRKAFSTPQMDLTLNDVACAVLTRGMRLAAERVASKNGHSIKDKRTAIFIPISVRPHGNWELANYTTGAIAWFPFLDPSSTTAEELLHKVNKEMMRIKRSHLPKLWYRTFDFVSRRRAWFVPNYLGGKQFFEAAYREYSVFTNVPGPVKPVKFGDHEAFAYHVLPPSSPGKATMALGAISYAGDFSLAVSVDDVPEFQGLPEEICAAFEASATELVEAAKRKLDVGEKAAAAV